MIWKSLKLGAEEGTVLREDVYLTLSGRARLIHQKEKRKEVYFCGNRGWIKVPSDLGVTGGHQSPSFYLHPREGGAGAQAITLPLWAALAGMALCGGPAGSWPHDSSFQNF